MSKTKIEWTEETWNPVTGCTKISSGCANCYAERMSKRLAGRSGYPSAPDNFKVTLHRDKLKQPFSWKTPREVFIASMGDLFHPDVPDDFIDEILAVIAMRQSSTFQILTKRPERMCNYINGLDSHSRDERLERAIGRVLGNTDGVAECYVSNSVNDSLGNGVGWPMRNLWLGVTAEDQEQFTERVSKLMWTMAKLHFVSCEPLLSDIDISQYTTRYRSKCSYCGREWVFRLQPEAVNATIRICSCRSTLSLEAENTLDWIIAGCETGPKARPMDIEWARSIRDQAVGTGIPFFFKGRLQKYVTLNGNMATRRNLLLDRKIWNQKPQRLRSER